MAAGERFLPYACIQGKLGHLLRRGAPRRRGLLLGTSVVQLRSEEHQQATHHDRTGPREPSAQQIKAVIQLDQFD
jgi:hypothetical protein